MGRPERRSSARLPFRVFFSPPPYDQEAERARSAQLPLYREKWRQWLRLSRPEGPNKADKVSTGGSGQVHLVVAAAGGQPAGPAQRKRWGTLRCFRLADSDSDRGSSQPVYGEAAVPPAA